MTPRVGQTIRLQDARGCWRLHTVAKDDKRFDGAIELAGQAWSGLRFFQVSQVSTPRGAPPRFLAGTPAIGPVRTPFSPLFLPAGWQPPAATRTA